MVELFSLGLLSLAIVLYVQARITARAIRRNRQDPDRLPPQRRIVAAPELRR